MSKEITWKTIGDNRGFPGIRGYVDGEFRFLINNGFFSTSVKSVLKDMETGMDYEFYTEHDATKIVLKILTGAVKITGNMQGDLLHYETKKVCHDCGHSCDSVQGLVCRRSAPVGVQVQMGESKHCELISQWPLVAADDWCGEFKVKETT